MRFVRRNRGLRYPRPCNRAFIARFSRYGVLLIAGFLVMLAKGLREQTVSEPVARDFYTRLETKPSSTLAEVVLRVHTRATLAEQRKRFQSRTPSRERDPSSFFRPR